MMSKSRDTQNLKPNPQWYKDAIIYELHVRAFHDSDGDGIGDFRGLTEKLDYLQDLGVTAIWLLPFCPSPLRDDGYDIADYADVHRAYGTLRDFQVFLKEAHRRDLRVISELVLNHTSDQHAWFQRSRRAKPGSRTRDFYVWSETPDKYPEARIIFKDFETSNWSWDPVAKAYYWHRFYSHQPDLNFDSPDVIKAVTAAVDFWFEMGVDGLRLDAVPYLYEREGTNCENLPETHAFLRQLRKHIDTKFTDRMLLAEANQWPEDAVAYFGNGDECHMAFHFPLMPRLFMAHRREERYPIVEILRNTPPIPDNCQWALFLRNHDELTLEMVTDEERDYMYRVYAHDAQARINLGIRRRLAPLLGNHRRRIELMNALLFTLPGTPVIYYGDEIGMGDNIYLGDRNGVRTPMQWNADRNGGFSRANPQRLYLPVIIDPEYHYEAINVEAQQNNPHALLWWMKRLIALRKRLKPLSRGTIEFLEPENRRVLVFLRRCEEESILVVANLARFSQPVELDLSGFRGMRPVEVFGHVPFPKICDHPYLLTLAPHGFYVFSLGKTAQAETAVITPEDISMPVLAVPVLEEALQREALEAFCPHLPAYLVMRRWFRSKSRVIRSAQIADIFTVLPGRSVILLVEVSYNEGEPETYLFPLSVATKQEADDLFQKAPQAVVARLRGEDGRDGILFSAEWDRSFCVTMLDIIRRRRRLRGEGGAIVASSTGVFARLLGSDAGSLETGILKAEQSNSSIVYGDRFILKLFRHIQAGVNPDLEIGRFLTEYTDYRNIPPVAGFLEHRAGDGTKSTVAVLNGFVANEGDAWQHTLDALGRYFERALAGYRDPGSFPALAGHPLELARQECSREVRHLVRDYLEDARLIGQRTAELHAALATDANDPEFTPEPMTDFYRQGLYHGMMALAQQTFRSLRQRLKQVPDQLQADAREVLERERDVSERFRPIRDTRIKAVRIRHHGDLHLGQILFTGRDFVIIDFEGEPARPLSERRIKRSPLRDVAGMVRSFHYASVAASFGLVPSVIVPRSEAAEVLAFWEQVWYLCASASFLKGYFTAAGGQPFVPQEPAHVRLLLDAFLLEKAIYEIGYELNNRPSWLGIPLRGVLGLIDPDRGPGRWKHDQIPSPTSL
jgi:maltose alpha-D-glucosyltransferase/alpha-amylase